MPDTSAEDVGTAIRQAREARGWTQLELARRAGVDISTVGRIERGVSPGTIGAGRIQAVLRIGPYERERDERDNEDQRDPRLSDATVEELVGALLAAHAREVRAARRPDHTTGVEITTGDTLPPEVPRRPRRDESG